MVFHVHVDATCLSSCVIILEDFVNPCFLVKSQQQKQLLFFFFSLILCDIIVNRHKRINRSDDDGDDCVCFREIQEVLV